jgi:hypothetical protein
VLVLSPEGTVLVIVIELICRLLKSRCVDYEYDHEHEHEPNRLLFESWRCGAICSSVG